MFKFIGQLILMGSLASYSLGADLVDPMKPQWPRGKAPGASVAGGTGKPGLKTPGQPKPKAPEAVFQLQSVSIIGQAKKAKINGQTVKVGQTVNGARVIKIESGKVTLVLNGRTKVLLLAGNRAKITSRSTN